MALRKIMHKDMHIPTVGTQRILMSLYFTVVTIDVIVLVWRKQNEKYRAKSIQTTVKSTVSVQVWGSISNRGMFLLRNG